MMFRLAEAKTSLNGESTTLPAELMTFYHLAGLNRGRKACWTPAWLLLMGPPIVIGILAGEAGGPFSIPRRLLHTMKTML